MVINVFQETDNMATRKTNEDFIKEATSKHDGKYSYNYTDYKNKSSKLIITCPTHGNFDQIAGNHLKGNGCPKCYGILRHTEESFLSKSKEMHGDKYDYSELVFKNVATNVDIICKIHGKFSQRASNHLEGRGCMSCNISESNTRRISLEEFKKRSNLIHCSEYDYSKSVFSEVRDKTIIICSIHGDFEQNVAKHMKGSRCPKCVLCDVTKTQSMVIEEFIDVHDKTYDYSLVKYVGTNKKVKIICNTHGEFEQSPKEHIRGKGCQKCGYDISRKIQTHTIKQFIDKANLAHKHKFDYSESEYVNSSVKVKIICDKGHYFYQAPRDHLAGHGCYQCSNIASKSEKEVSSFIESIYKNTVSQNIRSIIAPHELDIYLPDLGIAIEFNGLYWHSEASKHKKYHYDKWKKCASNNIRLVQIWEDEWRDKRELCESFLSSIILQPNKVYARKMIIKPVSVEEQRMFLSKYHFQGYVGATKCLGLYSDNDTLIQLMSLKKLDSQGSYEIGRLCTKSGHSVIGGSERLFKNLLKDITFTSIISFNNLDKFTGEVYSRLGMTLESEQIESYHYTDTNKIFSRQQFQKHKLVAQGYDINLTEHQIANSLGFYKVFPTGNSKYVMKHG